MLSRVFRRRVTSFVVNERGTATVEAVLWLPLFLFLMAFAADATMAFYSHSQVMKVLQDVNRSMSVGRIANSTDAEAKIRELLPSFAENMVVRVSETDGIIESIAQVPLSDIIVTGAVPGWMDMNITVRSYQYAEL